MSEQRPLLSAEDVERLRAASSAYGFHALRMERDGKAHVFGAGDYFATLADRLEEILGLFSAEMVEAIRICAAAASRHEGALLGEDADLADQAAGRIAALLPPEAP